MAALLPCAPVFVNLALERLACDSKLRTLPQLDELIEGYARAYGVRWDENDGAECEALANAAERYAVARWPDFTY